jgi:hypothetical protein
VNLWAGRLLTRGAGFDPQYARSRSAGCFGGHRQGATLNREALGLAV